MWKFRKKWTPQSRKRSLKMWPRRKPARRPTNGLRCRRYLPYLPYLPFHRFRLSRLYHPFRPCHLCRQFLLFLQCHQYHQCRWMKALP